MPPSWLRSVLREPLLHFLLLGAAVFVAYTWLTPPQRSPKDSQTIQVTKPALLQFIQQRNKNFDEVAAEQQLRSMSAAQRQQLVQDFVEEEALYRSALKLGLNEDDYVIRRRLVQKMDFMGRGIANTAKLPSEAELKTYFAANKQQYQQPATLTFTHVFLKANAENAQAIDQPAAKLQQQLNARAVSFNEAGRYGQRFLYQRNYVERPKEELASHFSATMADELFRLPVNSQWQGPLTSNYGQHLVLIIKNQPARLPALAEVRDAVARDLALAQSQQRQREFTQRIVAEFGTVIDEGLQLAKPAGTDAGKLPNTQ